MTDMKTDMTVNKRDLPITYLRPARGWIALNLPRCGRIASWSTS
jgi:hypothetical protein